MLTFPTQAEKCLANWKATKKTASLVKMAKKAGAFRDDEWPSKIVCVFPDDTKLEITGRGRAHSVEATLP